MRESTSCALESNLSAMAEASMRNVPASMAARMALTRAASKSPAARPGGSRSRALREKVTVLGARLAEAAGALLASPSAADAAAWACLAGPECTTVPGNSGWCPIFITLSSTASWIARRQCLVIGLWGSDFSAQVNLLQRDIYGAVLAHHTRDGLAIGHAHTHRLADRPCGHGLACGADRKTRPLDTTRTWAPA